MNNLETLEDVKKEILIIDCETYACYPNGKEISIKGDNTTYVSFAKAKWFGAFSLKHNTGYLYNVEKESDKIQRLFLEHTILVGFNSEDFDYPILVNNGLIHPDKKYLHVDCMKILGKSNFKGKDGYSFKNRGSLMKYNFKNNSMRTMAETMGLSIQKGDIDYSIFAKDKWTEEEEKEIKTYLKDDIRITKEIFYKLWDYWFPFTEFLDEKSIKNLTWIRSSIASLTYKSACFVMGTEPTYSETIGDSYEEMGGRVLDPKYEEARNVWYVDFTSLYPHCFCLFSLFNENMPSTDKNTWHGNDIFKVKGYYDISKKHPLVTHVSQLLKKRIALKKNNPNDPMENAIKIFLNGLYGVVRSPIFEKVHTTNSGWDCCWLGQQIHELTEKMMEEFGFEIIYGDTDSIMVIAKDECNNNDTYVTECLNRIVQKILNNVPFPIDTFDIKIEGFLDYIMFPFSEQAVVGEDGKNLKKGNRLIKERKGKKKNYLYIKDNEVTVMGLPLKKDNASPMGYKIFEEVLKPKILKEKTAKFPKKFIEDTVQEYLEKPDSLSLLAIEYKVKPFSTYKNEGQLQAQISKEYFNSNEGVISLIKNNKVGKVGKGQKYCAVSEAIENKLTYKDIDLTKVWNELEVFIALDNS